MRVYFRWPDPEGVDDWDVEADVEYERGQANVGVPSGYVVSGGWLRGVEFHRTVEIVPEDTTIPDGAGGRVDFWPALEAAILESVDAAEREIARERYNPGRA